MTTCTAIDLPPGVHGVTSEFCRDLERLKAEVAIVHLATDPNTPALRWGRESFFRRKSSAKWNGRLLLAYSRTASGRIVRGWFLNSIDQKSDCVYRDQQGCPSESAWLATIAPSKPSEPAWLYLRP